MLRDRNVVITGANRGIGLATVELLAENSANIWACARTQSDEYESRLHEIALKNEVSVSSVYFDVTDEQKVKESIRSIAKNAGHIDVLVNNAGFSTEQLFLMTSADMIRKSMETNFISQVRLCQLVSRYMIKNNSGSIVNIASVAGIESEEGGIAYGTSKAAVIFSSKTMALELGKNNVRINSVSPGFIDTDMWNNRNEKMKEKVLNETPLRRIGSPREVANVVLFLASDMSTFLTGQNIVVDGGRKKSGGGVT